MSTRAEKVRKIIAGRTMTARQIMDELNDGAKYKLITSCLRSMVTHGSLIGEGDGAERTYRASPEKKVYAERVGRNSGYTPEKCAEFRARIGDDCLHRAERIRRLLKIEKMTSADIAMILIERPKLVRASIHDLRLRGVVVVTEDGKFAYDDNAVNRSIDNKRAMSIGNKDRRAIQWDGQAETVEEFLARGGMIDTSPTPLKFERLTKDTLAPRSNNVGMGHQSPHQPRRFYGI